MRRWQAWGRAELPAGSVGVAMSPWQEWMVALGSPGWQVSWAVAPRVLAMYLGWFVELRSREGAASFHFICARSHLHPQSPPLEAWPFISAPPRPLVLPAALPGGTLLPTTNCLPKSLALCHLIPALTSATLGASPATRSSSALGSSWWRHCGCCSKVGGRGWGHRPGQTPSQGPQQPRLACPARPTLQTWAVCMRVHACACVCVRSLTGDVCFCAAGPCMPDACQLHVISPDVVQPESASEVLSFAPPSPYTPPLQAPAAWGLGARACAAGDSDWVYLSRWLEGVTSTASPVPAMVAGHVSDLKPWGPGPMGMVGLSPSRSADCPSSLLRSA